MTKELCVYNNLRMIEKKKKDMIMVDIKNIKTPKLKFIRTLRKNNKEN